ncbi:MAG: MFS transporter [Planctomycetes bacterium]|nr:MFS transporter [Planctomycetota bacterium]
MIKHLRWYICGLLMLATTINYLDRQTLSVAAPIIREKFNMSRVDYSRIADAFLLAYAIMHPISGRILDWLGTRAGFALAVTWWSIANVLHAFAGSVFSFRAFRFLLGIGESGNFPGAIKTISEWFPARERAFATGVMNVGAGAGAVIAPPLVGWLIIRFGWQAAFVVTGLTGFLWLALWLWLYHPPGSHPRLTAEERDLILLGQEADTNNDAPTVAQARGAWKEALSKPSIWALMAARFISDPVWFFYLFWLPDYLYTVRHFNLAEIAMFAWMPYLAADFGSLFGGAMSSLFSRLGFRVLTARKLAMCISAAMMPAAIFAVHADSPYVALFFISIATTAHQSWAAGVLTLPADLVPQRAVGSAYGFTGMAGIFGAFLFTRAVGSMVDSMGYVPVFTIVGFLHPLAALVVVLFVRTRRTGESQ